MEPYLLVNRSMTSGQAGVPTTNAPGSRTLSWVQAFVTVAACWPLGACLGEVPESALPVRAVATAQHCAAESGVSRIESEQALRAALGDAEVPDRPDFSRDLVLIVSMGQRMTAGYRVELASDTAQPEDGRHTIQVRMLEPSADAMTAQIITEPCLVIAMPNSVSRVHVVHADGKLVGTLESTGKTAP